MTISDSEHIAFYPPHHHHTLASMHLDVVGRYQAKEHRVRRRAHDVANHVHPDLGLVAAPYDRGHDAPDLTQCAQRHRATSGTHTLTHTQERISVTATGGGDVTPSPPLSPRGS